MTELLELLVLTCPTFTTGPYVSTVILLSVASSFFWISRTLTHQHDEIQSIHIIQWLVVWWYMNTNDMLRHGSYDHMPFEQVWTTSWLMTHSWLVTHNSWPLRVYAHRSCCWSGHGSKGFAVSFQDERFPYWREPCYFATVAANRVRMHRDGCVIRLHFRSAWL